MWLDEHDSQNVSAHDSSSGLSPDWVLLSQVQPLHKAGGGLLRWAATKVGAAAAAEATWSAGCGRIKA